MKIDLTIDLNAIRHNLTAYTGKRILMVKADAYGHGMTEVARAVDDLVYGYGVATVEEGASLRPCTKKDVLVCQWSQDEADVAERSNLTLSVTDFKSLDIVKSKGLKALLKINTGMNRFGFDREDLPLLKSKLEGVEACGIYSHVYSPEALPTQTEAFEEAGRFLELDGHLLSSRYNAEPHDFIRIGIGAYEGAMTVKSRVTATRRLRRGDVVGYGNALPQDGYVAWVFGGYADGIFRECPQPMMIEGRICSPIAVCMDSTALFTEDYLPKIGDEVILVGGGLRAEQVASLTHTVPYTVMTRWQGRVKRTYIC